jgi:hypothetical protein
MGVIDLKKFLVLFHLVYLFIIFVGWIGSATRFHNVQVVHLFLFIDA